MNAWKWLPLLLASCATPHVQEPTTPPILTSAKTPFARPLGAPLASLPDLYVAIRGRMRVRYDPDAFGAFDRPITLRLTNSGAQRLYVEPLRVAFTASRDGVSFPCREHVLGTIRQSEPTSLEPGQSFGFERDMDCTLPLPGIYQIRAFVEVGEGPVDVRPEDAAGAFLFEVESGPHVPQSYPSREGLFVIMNGRKVTRPMPPEAWARGDYRVVLAVINGGHRPVRVGPASLSFLTYRNGSTLPCSGQAEPLGLPEQLDPGTMRVTSSPVACAPSQEGHYEIVGRFSLGDGHEVNVGRISLEVTRNPARFTPELWPPSLGVPGNDPARSNFGRL